MTTLPRRAAPATLLALILLSCASARSADVPPPAAPAAASPAGAGAGDLVLLDSAESMFGASIVYHRVPTTAEITALGYYDNVQHVVIELPDWPENFSDIESLGRTVLPQGADLIVVLSGYPPSRSQAGIWNLVRQPLRIVMLVDGPPVDRGMILELNAVRGLERLVVTMDHPSRSGFERLQRPLSFRVVMP
jgi:hypothetical protein